MEGQIAGLGPDLVSALDPEEGPGLGVGPNLALNLEPAAEEAAKRVAKEKELAKVSIKKEDFDLIADEIEISKSKAERTLREHAGNVVEALAALTN